MQEQEALTKSTWKNIPTKDTQIYFGWLFWRDSRESDSFWMDFVWVSKI
jgi:hypothetical protein